MRSALKDYQVDAVEAVLQNLADARDDFKRRGRRTAFSLTATTGAGKTVMAAAVIEALFNGGDDFEFEADPTAVVLWFTDDPSLNEQTRFRIREVADRLPHASLSVIDNTFHQEKLEPGKVYFLNAQKLAKTSLLVKGASPDNDEMLIPRTARSDLRQYTMWDTLRNTIEDEDSTLYLILDEAHRGMKSVTKQDRAEKATIVRRLINGENGTPPVPVVWGISATVERFNSAMALSDRHVLLPAVIVDSARVQESGLLKDDIRLDFPVERGKFDTVLLRRATRKIRESTVLWTEYAANQNTVTHPVVPLLVVQVPNTPSDELLLSAFDTVMDEWPELGAESMAHVFGDHADITVGMHVVPHVSPQHVQDLSRIRVLFAKDAISTGWDCPRAEVLVSFRPAEDETHITQLLGRMVRTPLARRIPGNDRLNSVDCVLPFFNRRTASSVAQVLLGRGNRGEDGSGDSGGGGGRRVLLAPRDMTINAGIPGAVWEAFDELPSQTLPRKSARAVRRLTALAQALSRDRLLADARKLAHKEMFAVLDGIVARHAAEIAEREGALSAVEGQTLVAGMDEGVVLPGGEFREMADERSVESDFKLACRVLSPEIARKYAEYVAVEEDEDDGLLDAYVHVAALAALEGIGKEIDREADALAQRWFQEYRVAIKGLSDERRNLYSDLLGLSPVPQRGSIMRPRVRTEETCNEDGQPLATRRSHLMSDVDGEFPIASLNAWETKVLEQEMKQPGFVAWYRNPGRGSADSLAVAYRDGKSAWRRLCPDFIFFSGSEGAIRSSIIDPHGYHLVDALPKLRGLADFADEYSEEFHRIEAVAQMRSEQLRVLDLTSPDVRQAIRSASDAELLYQSDSATDY